MTQDTSSPHTNALSIAFRTLGCKLNQCETAQMEERVRACGYAVVPWSEHADVRVINSCTVTGKSDRECRHEARRAKRRDPSSKVVLTGCFPQVSPDAAATVAGVDLVLGNKEKLDLPKHLSMLLGDPPTSPASPYHERVPESGMRSSASAPVCAAPYGASTCFRTDLIHHVSGYTRAFLKVQTGCDSRCSYCIIPRARGPARSMPLAEVVRQVRVLGQEGYREVVLTGIHLGQWGRDTGEGGLAELLSALVADPKGPRLRLSSTEPMEITDRVLEVVAQAGCRIAPHFHVPLQSGSDRVLRMMNRPYSSSQYAERVNAIRRRFPEAAIGADVIVGFPGETDHDFGCTLELVARLPLTHVHVFAYSDRRGTPASALESKGQPEIIKARSRELRSLGGLKRMGFLAALEGRVLEVLVLQRRAENGLLEGLSGNYVNVHFPGGDGAMNTYCRVALDSLGADGVWRGHQPASGDCQAGGAEA